MITKYTELKNVFSKHKSYYSLLDFLSIDYFCVHSIQNWIEDLFWKQLDLNYPGMPDAMVRLAENFY